MKRGNMKVKSTSKNLLFSWNSIIGFFRSHEIAGPFLALIVLVIASASVSPQFLTLQNQMVILLMYIPLALLALGEAMIILMGSIDLSPGSVMGLVEVATAYIIVYSGIPIEYAILIGLGIGTLCGFINGILITKAKLPSFVVTLAMLLGARGVLFILTGGYSVAGKELYKLGVLIKPIAYIPYVPLYTWLFIPIVLIYYILLRKTTLGLYIYAIGGNEDAIRVSGVNADAIKTIAFTLAGFLYAVSGIFVLGQLQSGYTYIGQGYELNAIASCVLGGISLAGGSGNPFSPLIGALTLTLIQNILILLGVNPYYQWVITAIVLVAAGVPLTRGLRYAK